MRRMLVGVVVLILIAGAAGLVMAFAYERGNETESPRQVVVDASQTGTEVTIAPGDSLVVTLDSNVTTGFQWQLSSGMNEAVLALGSHEYQDPDKSDDGILGAGGREVWTFNAVGKGETQVDLEYRQAWEGGIKAAETFVLTVVVE